MGYMIEMENIKIIDKGGGRKVWSDVGELCIMVENCV